MAAASLGFRNYQATSNSKALEDTLVSGNYFAGIQFDDTLANITEYPKQLTFDIRFPSELRTATLNIGLTWFTMRLYPLLDLTGPRNFNHSDGGIPVGYLREGFIPVQHAISTAFIKLAGNVTELPEVVMQRFPYPEYIYDPLLQGLSSLMSLIILLSYIYPCTYIAKVCMVLQLLCLFNRI